MAKAQLDWLKTEKGDEGQGEHPSWVIFSAVSFCGEQMEEVK